MDTSLLQLAGSLGVGAFLGALIFLIYRRDRQASEKSQREDRRFMEDRLTQILHDEVRSREENTKALTELTILISRLNGKMSKE